MQFNHFILLVIFVAAAVIGYFIIRRVPSLLHTPLMSGMNALSGITVLGCLTVSALSVTWLARLLGILAITFGMINVVAGFAVTDRMLKMFHREEERGDA